MIVRELVTKLGFSVQGDGLARFESAIKNAKNNATILGQKISNLGSTLTRFVTLPILGAGIFAVKNWDEQAKAIAQVEQGLKSTGNTAKLTLQQISAEADRLQSTTLFGDDAILKDASAQLLTFTNITGQLFFDAQKAVLDISTRLGQDLKSSSIQIGKALNDPIKGISALSRVGVKFTDQQKTIIENLVKTNRLTEAQRMILNELNIEFGGSAEAAARVGLGPWQQLANLMSDVLEDFGQVILDLVKPLIPIFKGWLKYLKELSPQTKKFLTTILALTAGIGPLLFIVGGLITKIGIMTIVFGALDIALAPIILTVLAIAAALGAVYLVFDDIRAYMRGEDSFFKADYDRVAQGVNAIKEGWKKVSEFVGDLALIYKNDLQPILESVGELANTIFQKFFIEPTKQAWEWVKKLASEFTIMGIPLQAWVDFFDQIIERMNIIDRLKDSLREFFESSPIVQAFRMLKQGIGNVQERADDIRAGQQNQNTTGIVGALNSANDFVKGLPPIIPSSTAGAAAGLKSETNNDIKIDQKFEFKLESESDPKKIGDEVGKRVKEEMDRSLRQTHLAIASGEI